MHDIQAKSLLTRNRGMNIYRGCVHGCVYCDSRSSCYRFTHPFEDVGVKRNAPELLEDILKRSRERFVVSTGSMCDPYQPCERELKLMRRCLELIEQYGFGASVITKSDLVLRDLDLFESINGKAKSVLQMTLTVADDALSRMLEPNVCTSTRRYEVLKEFQKRGVPTVVWLCPILPYLTDSEENLRAILDMCFDAGVRGVVCFGAGMTLREGSREYYCAALDRLFPGMSERYRSRYGNAYELVSPNGAALMRIFREECGRRGVLFEPEDCFRFIADMPRRSAQISLFDDGGD